MALSRDGLYDQIIKRLEQILDEAADLDGAFGALEAETDALRRELDGLDLGLHRFETSIDLGAQRASFSIESCGDPKCGCSVLAEQARRVPVYLSIVPGD
jgi:hypothetical protein